MHLYFYVPIEYLNCQTQTIVQVFVVLHTIWHFNCPAYYCLLFKRKKEKKIQECYRELYIFLLNSKLYYIFTVCSLNQVLQLFCTCTHN